MPRILGLESSCDETSAAVVSGTAAAPALESLVILSQDVHRIFGGVVPEIASRAHVERILPVIDQTLRRAGLQLADLNAVAVANTPGLAGSLLVGLSAAKVLCLALDVPLVAVNHLQAHVYACRMAAGRDVYPCVALVASGGHTSLYYCPGPLVMDLLGGTIDDAAGEAFDKVASLLGLGYPGGPAIQRAAEAGNPRAYGFPRSFLHEERLDFSFSGLKTAVRYQVWPPGTDAADRSTIEPRRLADLAASFQEAVIDVLAGKSFQAVDRTGCRTLCVGGGVAANRRLRERLQNEAKRRCVDLHIAPPELCTDNAVMGAIAVERLRAGLVESLDLDAFPGVLRPAAATGGGKVDSAGHPA